MLLPRLSICLVFLWGALWAVQANPIDSTLAKCRKANSTTQGTLQCLNETLGFWDVELNKEYKELRDLISAQEREKLKVSQVQWIAFRDAEVKFLDDSYSRLEGTIYKEYLAERKLELTRSRALQLKLHVDAVKEGKGGI